MTVYDAPTPFGHSFTVMGMTRPLWKTWRAAGAPASATGAHRSPGVSMTATGDVRGTVRHGR
ncbi:hypothetical protein J0H58_00140, partial [bacterium]|nr:hypothetical protein [bacterium]